MAAKLDIEQRVSGRILERCNVLYKSLIDVHATTNNLVKGCCI